MQKRHHGDPYERLSLAYRSAGGAGLRALVAAVRESRDRILSRLHSEPDPAPTGWPALAVARGLETHRALAGWVLHRVGVAPRVWPGVKLVPAGETDGARLRVQIREAGPSLALVFSVNEQSPTRPSDLAALGELPRRLLPPGLRVQVVRLLEPPPRNPHVEGLVLQGEIHESWA